MVAKFPFKDPVISSLGFLNPTRRGEDPPSSVTTLAKRFPSLVPEAETCALEDEYADYCVTPAKEMPAHNDIRVDEYWGKVSAMTNRITDTQRFPRLCKIAQALLTMPNSNADCERLFSIVRKVQTEYRSSMDNDTLCSLLTCKLNTQCACFELAPSKDTLKKAKSASYSYNQDHPASVCVDDEDTTDGRRD